MAIYADLFADQGSHFSTIVNVSILGAFDADLTGYTARGRIKKSYSSSTSVDFVTSIPDPTNGQIAISLSSETTAGMKPGRYVYDIEVVEVSTLKVTRVVEGQIEVMPGVTSGLYSNLITSITSMYEIRLTDYTILCDATSGAFLVILPDPSTLGITGKTFVIKKIDSSTNNITVIGTVDATVNPTVSDQWELLRVQSDGSFWYSI